MPKNLNLKVSIDAMLRTRTKWHHVNAMTFVPRASLFCFFNLFLSFFSFSFNGERSNYIISLRTEPPITLSNKQLQRNGVHANDFNMFFKKKLQEVKRVPFNNLIDLPIQSKPSNGFTFGLSQESRYSTILISMNRGQIQAAYCLL